MYSAPKEIKDPTKFMYVKKLEAEVTAKLQMLEYTHTKSKAIVGRANTEAAGRQRDTLRNLVKEVDALKLQTEQAKFTEGVKCEDVAEWSRVDIEI